VSICGRTSCALFSVRVWQDVLCFASLHFACRRKSSAFKYWALCGLTQFDVVCFFAYMCQMLYAGNPDRGAMDRGHTARYLDDRVICCCLF